MPPNHDSMSEHFRPWELEGFIGGFAGDIQAMALFMQDWSRQYQTALRQSHPHNTQVSHNNLMGMASALMLNMRYAGMNLTCSDPTIQQGPRCNAHRSTYTALGETSETTDLYNGRCPSHTSQSTETTPAISQPAAGLSQNTLVSVRETFSVDDPARLTELRELVMNLNSAWQRRGQSVDRTCYDEMFRLGHLARTLGILREAGPDHLPLLRDAFANMVEAMHQNDNTSFGNSYRLVMYFLHNYYPLFRPRGHHR